MNRRSAILDRLSGFTILMAAVVVAFVAPSRGISIIVILVALAGTILGPRFALDRAREILLTLFALAFGVVAVRIFPGSTYEVLGLVSDRVALLGSVALSIGAARATLEKPIGGAGPTVTCAIVATTTAGRTIIGPMYPATALAVVLLGLTAIAWERGNRRGVPLSTKRVVSLALAVAIAVGASFLAGATLPKMSRAFVAAVSNRRPSTGFSERLWLGSLEGMLQSDRVVLRLRGDEGDYLRGAVFVRYGVGLWEPSRRAGTLRFHDATPGEAAPVHAVSMEYADKTKIFFAPLDAELVGVSSEGFSVDAMGIARPIGEPPAKRTYLARPGTPPIPPEAAEDLQIPRRVAPALSEHLAGWGVSNDMSPQERVDRIVAKLGQEYRYSLEFTRKSGVDPVLEFLESDKQGHCEYFASALVLLSRAAGVPARLVAGYRAVERSTLGDYVIVRERHAHSWAEVWVDDAWHTTDATPEAALSSSDHPPSAVGGFFDYLATTWEKVDDFLAARTAAQFSSALVGLIVVLVVVRAVRLRRLRPSASFSDDRPLTSLVTFLDALALRGIHRADHETLGQLCRRLESELPEALARQATELIAKYEALRYGNLGSPDVLTRLAEEFARASAERPEGAS